MTRQHQASEFSGGGARSRNREDRNVPPGQPGTPHTPEVEDAVLGTILNNPDLFNEIEGFADDLFYQHNNRLIAQAIRQLNLSGIAADLVTTSQYLESRSLMDQAGGKVHIASLLGSSNGAYLEHYVGILKVQRDLRRHEEWAREMLRAVSTRDVDRVHEVAAHAPTEGEESRGLMTTREANAQVMDELERQIRGEKNEVRPTGIRRIDEKLVEGGLISQQLVVIGARPSIGKSVMAQNIARNIARVCRKIVLMHCMEMPSKDMQMRALTAELGQHPKRMIAQMGAAALPRIQEAMQLVEEEILYDDRSEQSIEDIAARARSTKRQYGSIGAIVIDYLQLMKRPRGNNSNDQINEITRRLKALAREMDCPVILLSQLSRDVEKRPDKRPIMADLRESGGIEQDSDIVILLYRDHYYNPKADPHTAEGIIAKQRGGPVGTVQLHFSGPTFTFS